MGAAPLISIVVPVRDRRVLLEQCLRALTAQTASEVEIIVADDGSTDGSADVAEALGASVVRSPGIGAVAARCAGVAVATGDVLAFTDSDCIPDRGWAAAGAAAIDAGADVVQGRTIPTRPPGPLERTVQVEREDGLYATCNVFYRRSAFDAAGGFDTTAAARLGFRHGRRLQGLGFGEDTLLGWRVRRSGRAAFSADAVVAHHVFEPDIAESLRRAWAAGGFPALFAEVPELRDHLGPLGGAARRALRAGTRSPKVLAVLAASDAVTAVALRAGASRAARKADAGAPPPPA